MRSHDAEAVELLAVPQAQHRREFAPSLDIGAAPEEGQPDNRLLLRFAAPRDPVMVARWVSFNVIDTERQDWARGYNAATKFFEREGHLRVPFEHREDRYPLGHWISEQRKVYGAGMMDGKRAERLDGIGMVWDPLDAAFEENLAACRVYYADHGTLCAPRSATALDKPIGQWLSNQRRPGALAGRPDRAEALAAIDPDWNPDWPLDWQRHHAAVQEVLGLGAELADLEEGVTVHGLDIGRWLERQRQHIIWQALKPAQHERLTALGVHPNPAPAKTEKPGRPAPGGRTGAFERGLAALTQYKAREGSVIVPRSHIEELDDGSGAEVRLGVFLSNTKTRRAKLTPEQLDQLAELGLDWR